MMPRILTPAASGGEAALLQQLVTRTEQLAGEVATATHLSPSSKAVLQDGGPTR